MNEQINYKIKKALKKIKLNDIRMILSWWSVN
jgi:hypothetical protein